MFLEALRRFAYVAGDYPPGSADAEEFAALELMAAAKVNYNADPTPSADLCWAITQNIWEKAMAKLDKAK